MSPCMPHQIRFQRSIFLTKLLKWRFIILKLIHFQIYFLLYQLLVISIISSFALSCRDEMLQLCLLPMWVEIEMCWTFDWANLCQNYQMSWLSLSWLSFVKMIFVMSIIAKNIFCHLWNNQLPAMNWSNDERLLDIGCGSGDVTRFMFIILIMIFTSILVTRLSLILILLILIYQYWY